jgi:hypothetical protein
LVTFNRYKDAYFCTMKLVTIVLLSLLLLSNSLRLLAVYGWYILDIDSFIEQLCENKDKPQLECNGNCYLSKVTTESSNQKDNQTLVVEWEQLVFYQVENCLEIKCLILFRAINNYSYSSHYKEGLIQSIFHPP